VRALVLGSDGRLSLQHRDRPRSVDECLIRVTAAGICGTDLELQRGYAQFTGVPGHEFVGIVEQTPDEDAHWMGLRVVGEITVGCDRCDGCRAAGRGHCDVRSVMGILGRDGAFAEYLVLPAVNLHAVPDSLDDATAVFVEPTAAAYRVVDQVPVDGRTRAAVVGAGRLGLLVAQVLRERGADTVVFVRGDPARALCTELGLNAARPGLAARAWGGWLGSASPLAFQARVALARLGDERARAQILRGLSAWSRETRTRAVAAAGQARLEAARARLLQMRGDERQADPESVIEALRALDHAPPPVHAKSCL